LCCSVRVWEGGGGWWGGGWVGGGGWGVEGARCSREGGGGGGGGRGPHGTAKLGVVRGSSWGARGRHIRVKTKLKIGGTAEKGQ